MVICYNNFSQYFHLGLKGHATNYSAHNCPAYRGTFTPLPLPLLRKTGADCKVQHTLRASDNTGYRQIAPTSSTGLQIPDLNPLI